VVPTTVSSSGRDRFAFGDVVFEVDPQVGAVGCERGDIFLLTSDGLTEGLYDHYIVDILRAEVAVYLLQG